MNTLALGYVIPAIRAYSGLSPVRQCSCRAYNQESTISGSGNGRLFPTLYTLYHQEVSSRTSVSGRTTFVNTSEISKRNGRVYHYTFPDGAIPPRLTFQLDTEKEGTTGNKIYNVTFDMSNLKDGFIPARWYKINVTIKGTQLDDKSDITISNFNI